MPDQTEMSAARPARPPSPAPRERTRSRGGDARAGAALWLVALGVGMLAGYAAIGFRLAVSLVQKQLYGADDHSIHSAAAALDPLLVMAIPIIGGVVVGWILSRYTRGGKALGVADVIEAAALRDGRVNRREGLASAAAALVTLSTGGSTGREGPAVHLAAVIAGWIEDRFDFHGLHARDILGCAVAAAVSASFNAPLAGTLFALEVVLRHYAVHAFGPIVLASVAGTIVSRTHMGNVTEFMLPPPTQAFYAEVPAFGLLGVICGLVAVLMIKSIFIAESLGDRAAKRLRLGPLQRPALAGALLGAMAVWFPHIIGVGYETTIRALTMDLGFWACVVFAATKTVAVGLTFAGRMGGGIFSPSLMMGALVGSAFGLVATAIAPVPAASQALYAMAGMGAVASAVLGAPISTTLIVFELTGDYQTAIAVMISVSLATVVAHAFVRKSFFLTQLARAGVELASGPQKWLPKTIPVRRLMRLRGAEDGVSDTAAQALIDQGVWLTREDTLALALPMFERLKGPFIPVVDMPPEGQTEGRPELIGALFHIDALKTLNRILEETHHEEHS